MQISARIGPDDIRDFVVFVRYRDRTAASRFIAFLGNIWDRYFSSLAGFWFSYSMVLGMLAFVATLGWALYQGAGDILWQDPVLMALVLIGILLLPVGYTWLRGNHQLQRKIENQNEARGGDAVDETLMRDGIDIGKARFEFDDDGVRATFSLLEEFFTWEAFQQLEETESNFLLMIDRGSALIVPKRAFSGSKGQQGFRTLVQSRMAAR